MARIPTAANVAQAPSARDPGVRVPAIGQEVAQAGADIGRGLALLAEKQQVAEDRRFLADFDSAVRTRTAETVLQFEGQQESSDYSARVAKAVQGIGPSVLQEFESNGYTPSRDARVRAETGFTGLLTNTRVAAITDQHNAKVAAALRGIQNNADVHLNTLMSNPSRQALDATRELLTETFDAAEGLANPDVLARMRDEYQGGAYKSYVSGLISKGQLGLARQELGSDEANEALDPNDKARLQNELERESRAFVAQKASEVNQTLKGIETVIGVAPPSTAMVNAAQAQVDSLPPSMRPAAQARLDALVAIGQQNEQVYYLPPDQQAALQRQMDTALRQGATPDMIERKKAIDDIVESSQKQREQDATVMAVGFGAARPPTVPMDLTNPDYQRQVRDVSTATVGLYGLDVQPLPREAYDEVERALTAGTTDERVAAAKFLGGLGLAARSATLGQLGNKVSPTVLLAIDNAEERPDVAASLARASAQDVKVTLPSNNDILPELDVGAAFADAPDLLTDTIAAAKSLVAADYASGALEGTDLTQAVVKKVEYLLDGRVVDLNGGQVLLPSNLRDKPSRPTVAAVKERLPELDTPERQSAVLVPLTGGAMLSLPEGAQFEGLFYAGTNEQVPWEKFAGSPMGQQVAPGVYAPQLDGSTRGAVVGRYRYEFDGAPRTSNFAVAVDLNKVVGLAPMPDVTPSPERLEQEAAQGLENLRRGFEAPKAGDQESLFDKIKISPRSLDELAGKDDLIGYAARALREVDINTVDIDKLAKRDDLVGWSLRLFQSTPVPEEED